MNVATDSPSRWAELITSNFIDLRISDTAEDFSGSFQPCDLGEAVRLTVVEAGRSRVSRDHRGVRSDASDDVLLLAPLSGTGVVRQEGTELVVAPGSTSLHVADRPYELVFECPGRVVVFQAPRRTVPAASLVAPERRRTLLGGAIGRVFTAFAAATVASAEMIDHEREELRLTATRLAVELMGGGALTDRSGGGHWHIAMMAREFIRHRLADPDITPALVARSQGVSLRSLQLAFEREDSTPAAYIRRERLRWAGQILEDPRWSHCTIEEIAHRTGFRDVNGFIRAFKRNVGSTPSAWRRERSADGRK